jgi:energy-coupling factor transporter ATP-binding protein EcfA2
MPDETDSSPSKAVLWLITAFALFGVPAAATYTFRDLWLRAPIRAVVAVISYELIVVIAAFATKVWTRLQNRWAEKIADALADTVESWFSLVTLPHYKKYMLHRHRAFDVKGLGTQGIHTLQMEQVFVDLGIVPQPAHRASVDPFGRRDRVIPNQRYSIAELLQKIDITFQSIVILGPPGSGKTTLLKHMTLILASNQLPRKYHRIPVLLFLREHADTIRAKPDILLLEVIKAGLASPSYSGTLHWIGPKLRRGKCVVLLDGLDEIADPTTRRTVASWIDRQIQTYNLARFFVTSRPFGYKANPLEQVSVFEARPFTGAQIKQFVKNWYLANEIMAAGGRKDPGVVMLANDGASDLIARLNKAWDLAELAVNPLLLTMIATVHRFRSSLPGKRVALYSEMCDVFLGNRQRAKGMNSDETGLEPKQKRRVLEPLAHEMMNRKTREIGRTDAVEIIKHTLAGVTNKLTPNQFLSNIENFSGVLLERENGVYSFAHLTFQEFLSASHIRSQQLESEVIKHINESWWHEVLRLYCAEGDATPIIEACLSSREPTIEALTLAAGCMEEAFEVRPDLRHKLEAVLEEAHADGAKRLLGKQQLQLRLRRLLRN